MAAAGPKKAEWLTCIRIVWIRYHKQLAKHSSIHLTFFVNGVLVDIFTAAVSGQAGESGGKTVFTSPGVAAMGTSCKTLRIWVTCKSESVLAPAMEARQ